MTAPMRAGSARLLEFDEELRMTRPAWLTTPAVEVAIDKLRYLRGKDAHHLDLSMLPQERRRFLATLGRRSTVQGLQRRGERRYPILLARVAGAGGGRFPGRRPTWCTIGRSPPSRRTVRGARPVN